MDYYGIKTPDQPGAPSYIWWITNSMHTSWMAFFTQEGKNGEVMYHRATIATARRAYEAIGYKCVKLNVTEVETGLCQACGGSGKIAIDTPEYRIFDTVRCSECGGTGKI